MKHSRTRRRMTERWPPEADNLRGREIYMKCPFCLHLEDKVVDSRESREGDVIRRRRECLKCERRFTSYERIDEIPYMVVKKDGRREPFDRDKIMSGVLKACEKRQIPTSKIETLRSEES